MATSEDYIRYVCVQIDGAGAVRSRKMFGEYMVYVGEKPVFLVCDNTVFVKILPALESEMAGAATGFPYPGAKLHAILDIDDREKALRVAAILRDVTPLPKPKRKKETTGRG